MIIELREYEIKPGYMKDFVHWMENKNIPHQIQHGVVFLGSFE